MKKEIKLFVKTAINEEFHKLKSFLENADISQIKITFGNSATEIECIDRPMLGIFYRDRQSGGEPFHIWIQSYWGESEIAYNLNLSGIENYADTDEIYFSFCVYVSRLIRKMFKKRHILYSRAVYKNESDEKVILIKRVS